MLCNAALHELQKILTKELNGIQKISCTSQSYKKLFSKYMPRLTLLNLLVLLNRNVGLSVAGTC